MAEISTVRVTGGPVSATPVASALIPPNTFVGHMSASTDGALPTLLTGHDGNEVLQDGTTGLHQLNVGAGDYFAVNQPGVYLVTWTFEASASLEGPTPATGSLGEIALSKHNGLSTFVYAGDFQPMNAIEEGFGDAGIARGGGSAIVWLGVSNSFEDGLNFIISPSPRTDLVSAEVGVNFSATLLQSGGDPFIHTEA